MQSAKHIVITALIVTILFSGLPLLKHEDANKDTFVNLEDAILHVMNLAQEAEGQETFISSMKRVITTFHLVAGLKRVIKQEKDQRSSVHPQSMGKLYLINKLDHSFQSDGRYIPPEKINQYQSIILSLSSPPPKFS